MRGFVVAVVGLAVLLPACTGSRSGTLNATATTSVAPSLESAPQPAKCPRQWTFDPVDGSDTSMVPGDPVAAVTCSGHHRYVHTGSQMTQIVHLLNSRRHIDAQRLHRQHRRHGAYADADVLRLSIRRYPASELRPELPDRV